MLFSFLPGLHRLLAPVDDEGGGGGGGGSGSGGAGDGAGDRQHGSGGDGATGSGVSEARVNEIVSKALGSRFKSFEEKQTKALDAALGEITESVSGTLTTQLAELTEKLGTKGGQAAEKPADTDITKNPEFIRLQRAAKKSEEELTRINQEKAEADARAKAATLRERAREALTKGGVEEKKLGRLVSSMIADGQVKYDEDGKIVFDVGDGPEDLDRGVKSWVASDEGKTFLPPRGANGSGDGARSQGGNGQQRQQQQSSNGTGTQASKVELGNALIAAARGQLSSS